MVKLTTNFNKTIAVPATKNNIYNLGKNFNVNLS